jgi:hypothetical protein
MGLLGPKCWILPDRLRELRHIPAPFSMIVREDVRVAEAQIHMCMRSEVKDGVNIVFLETPDHVAWYCDIAVEEAEIRLRL